MERPFSNTACFQKNKEKKLPRKFSNQISNKTLMNKKNASPIFL
jgi:hypothetical protein